MTPAEFKKKWSKFTGKESSGYQSHFDDLCRLLKVPTPLEADPDAEFFCFQKRVVKDAELFAVAESGEEAAPDERGFADVWKRGCFAWEYKGKRKNLDEAYKQLLRYREALENPPLLVVCDFDRYLVETNFNGTVQEVFEFTNDTLDRPENRPRRTHYRGPLLIQAGTNASSFTVEESEPIEQRHSLRIPDELEFGGIVGVVEVVDCVEKHLSPWFIRGNFAWVLANPRRLRFRECKGQLGLFYPFEE